MSANLKYHITLSNSDGEKGFLFKKYSARKRPDSLFGSRFATGDPTYSNMSRWQRFAQTSWLNGAFQTYLEDITKFKGSSNIDCLTSGEIKISRALSSKLYDEGADVIRKGLYFNGVHFWSEGRYIKYSSDFVSASVSKDFGAGIECTDLAIYNGELFAAIGTQLWKLPVADYTSWTEEKFSAASIPADYLRTWGDYLYISSKNKFSRWDGTAYTVIKDFSTGAANAYFVKKPTIYAGQVIIPVNTEGTSNGYGQVYFYNGTDFDIIYEGYDPVGHKCIVYDSRLYFVTYGKYKCTIKEYNGSQTVTKQTFPISAGTTLYGTALLYGSGALYGQGADRYEDPVEFSIWNETLMIVIKRTFSQNNIIAYDGFGFSNYVKLAPGSGVSATMWVYNRDLYIGDSDGDIYRLTDSFNSDGILQSSIWDAEMQDIKKLFGDITVKHEGLVDGDSIEVFYRLEADGEFISMGSSDVAGSIESVFELQNKTYQL